MCKNQQKRQIYFQECLLLCFYSHHTTGGASLASVQRQHLIYKNVLVEKSENFWGKKEVRRVLMTQTLTRNIILLLALYYHYTTNIKL